MSLTPTRPAAADWPDLDVVPSGPRARVAARLARPIFRAALSRPPVTVRVGDDPAAATIGSGGPLMTIHRPDEFFARVGSQGLIGFGEAYLTGAWDAEDLAGFLTVLAADLPNLVPAPLQKLRAAYVARPPRHQKNTVDNTRDNIAHHYDLSNDLFATFLDPTLSYSSALFESGFEQRTDAVGEHLVASPPADPLTGPGTAALFAEAQGRKIERMLDEAQVGQGSRVLEIGTGWGELAIRAARRGATVRSVTLSSEQQALARERIAAAGHADAVDVDLCDYRLVTGEYDAVLSVEMIEAVGHEYWGTYFSTIDKVLAPGGHVSLQAITMPHDRMLATKQTHTWINKYIFPGGFLPSVQVIDQITRTETSLRLTGRLSMGRHYAQTLRLWDEAFLAASARVLELGFDATFLRMWHFYLDYSRAGFASGYLDVNQLTFAREGLR